VDVLVGFHRGAPDWQHAWQQCCHHPIVVITSLRKVFRKTHSHGTRLHGANMGKLDENPLDLFGSSCDVSAVLQPSHTTLMRGKTIIWGANG